MKLISAAFAVLCANGSRKNRVAGCVPTHLFPKTFSADVLRNGIRLKRADYVPDVFINGVGQCAFRVIKTRGTKIGIWMRKSGFDWSASGSLALLERSKEQVNALAENVTSRLMRRVSVRASRRTDGKRAVCVPVLILRFAHKKFFEGLFDRLNGNKTAADIFANLQNFFNVVFVQNLNIRAVCFGGNSRARDICDFLS